MWIQGAVWANTIIALIPFTSETQINGSDGAGRFENLRSLAPELGCVKIILTLLTYIIYNTITSSSPLTIIGWREWDSIRVPAEEESSNGRAGTRTNSARCRGRVARPGQTGERWRPGGGDTRGFVISFWKYEDFLNKFVYTFIWSRAFFVLKTI